MSYTITIVTVTYNDIQGFARTSKSVIPQLNSDIQWIIKDGGSSPCILAQIKNISYPHALLITTKDTSVYDGMNIALDYAKGKFLLFLNGGDTLASDDLLTKLCRAISEVDDTPMLLLAPYIEIDCYTIKRFVNVGATSLNYFSKWRMPTVAQSQLFSRDIYTSQRFTLNHSISADHLFYWKAITNFSPQIKILNYPIAHFYLGGISTRFPFRSANDVLSCLLIDPSISSFEALLLYGIRLAAGFRRYLLELVLKPLFSPLYVLLNLRFRLVVWALGINGEGSSIIANQWFDTVSSNSQRTLFVCSRGSLLSQKLRKSRFRDRILKDSKNYFIELPSFFRFYPIHFFLKLIIPINLISHSLLVLDDYPFALSSNQVLYFHQLNLLKSKSIFWRFKRFVFRLLLSSSPMVYCQTNHVAKAFTSKFTNLRCFSFLHNIS
ncbi:glycosyltransferase [Synechococcus sp. MIT S9451]|uniref:glycosyltransferase n=1 Tax=Synechococcus sp. MIT S9451 TaxID=3082543 RepID=UPI0039B3CDE7